MSARRRRNRESGAIALEAVIVWPAVILVVFAIIQGGLWFHGRNVALGAAQEGARVASSETRGDGVGRASSFIADAGGSKVLTVEGITQDSDGTTITITVTARAPSVFPGVAGPRVTQSSTAPLKNWTTP